VRILYFSRDYTSHDHRFLDGLAATEHDVHYLRLEKQSLLERRPLPEGIEPVALSGSKGSLVMQTCAIGKLLRTLQPDIIHAGPVQACAFPAALAGAHPLVTMSWGSDMLVDAERGWGRWQATYALRRSDVFLCDCEVVRQRAMELGVSPDRIIVFPWGVNLTHFSPGDGVQLRRELGWEDTFIVLSSRSFEPIYGVDTLVKGWIAAAKENPRLRLLMLGSGSQESMLRDLLEGAGFLGRVHFAGQVAFEDLPAHLRTADLYVSASHSDGSSISLLESMACGLPAVVSDIPGNREWVEPGVNGWWFADGNDQALGEALTEAVQVGEALSAYGARSRIIAEARANWQDNFPKLLEGYHLARSLAGGSEV